ncbi:hypothetical protein OY671_010192, partial [Metschnikowia pulcherrima]
TTEGATVSSFAGFRIDLRLRELRDPEGARVAMTSAEFDSSRTSCERPGRVLSRDSSLDSTQGRNAGSFERSIDVSISRIRRKIEPDPIEPTSIKTQPSATVARHEVRIMKFFGFLNSRGISGQIAALVVVSVVASHSIITASFSIHRP